MASSKSSRDLAPIATIAPQGQVYRIIHVDPTALHLGIHPGRTLADGKAIAPELIVYPDDPPADRRALELLAIQAYDLAPVVHIASDCALFADVTGCERLFDGEENLLARAMEGAVGRGFSVRAAIADTPGAAWAVARAHDESATIVPPGQSAAYLTPLPVWTLRIDASVVDKLSAVGIETVGSLLHLPRSSLAMRFGEPVLDRIDQAFGDLAEILEPFKPPRAITSMVELGMATANLEPLRAAIDRALERFCDQLERKSAGVCQVFGTFYCRDVDTEHGLRTRTVTMPVNLSTPTRSVRHLRSLLAVLLDQVRLPAPADRVMLWARDIEPLDDRQGELLATDTHDARKLGDLLDRLAVRLGDGAVVRPRLLSEHQPERAYRYVAVADSATTPTKKPVLTKRSGSTKRPAQQSARKSVKKPSHTGDGAWDAVVGPRPVRLLSHPREIVATAIAPEGPPISFRYDGTGHAVVESAGPERIETGWWRGPPMRRDYYRVTTDAGRRCWVFCHRDTGRWFLHGWFD